MWQVNLTSNPTRTPSHQQPASLNTLEEIINLELAKWYHAALFIPVKKILLQAIKNGHFTTWTNLTVEIMKHLPPSMATAKCHTKQIRKSIKSIKTQVTTQNKDEQMETFETRSNHFFTDIIDPQQRIATNLTVRLQVNPSRRNKYLFILYNKDINCILVWTMKSRTDKEFICVFQDLHGHLTTRGLNPNYMQLDNEASPAFQALLKEK